MSRLFTSVLSSASIVFSTAVYAQTPSAQQASSMAPIEVKAKKVCKSEPVVGSRFAKKICHTQAEWDAIRLNDRQMTEGYQQNACRAGASSQGGSIQC